MTTLREHLEGLIAELENIDGRADADEYALGRCGQHAVAALELLKKADTPATATRRSPREEQSR